MPYIIMKRDDVANGVLQILDILPNTSQRNTSIDPPGQSKYIRIPLNERLVTVGAGPVTTFVESRGLGGWFLTNVPGVAGVQAAQTGTVGVGAFAALDTVTIGLTTLTATAGAPAVDEFTVTGVIATDTTSLVNAINNSANGTAGIVTAVDGGGGVFTVTAVLQGTAGNAIVTTDAAANFSWGGVTLTGGVDAVALTAAEAGTMATDIFADLLRFGDNANPTLTMNLAAVNGIVAAVVGTAVITAAQLLEVLDILSGRLYIVPQGTQIEDGANIWVVSPVVGSATGPRFEDPSFRRSYESDDFVISWGQGSLNSFRDNLYSYKEVVGAMVAVLNDDGTLYTAPV